MKAWTKPEAIAALQREAKRIGRTPFARDTHAPGCLCPTYKVYRRLFGSIRAAQIKAGLTPSRVGGKLGWRKRVCHRGHRRVPSNLSSQGHCLTCARDWKTPRKPAGLGGHITLMPLDPDTAREKTEAKKAFWSSVERSETAPQSPAWTHPYARRRSA